MSLLFLALAFCSYGLTWIAYTSLGADHPCVTTGRSITSISLVLGITPVWASIKLDVLWLLLQRPRVLYFLGAFALRSALVLPMVHSAKTATDIVSFSVQELCACATYCLVPLSDSLPPRMTTRFLRLVCIACVLTVGVNYLMCKYDPVTCNDSYHDFAWTISERSPVNANNSSVPNHTANPANPANRTTPSANRTTPQHAILSSLDVWQVCNFMLCVLAAQILFSNLTSPTTTNVIKEPIFVDELYSEGQNLGSGINNVCATIFGETAGIRVESLMSRWMSWLIAGEITLAVLVPDILHSFEAAVEAQAGAAVSATLYSLAFCISSALCLKTRVLMRLAQTIVVYYYALSIIVNSVSLCAIWYERRAYHGAYEVVKEAVLTLVLIVVLPLLDAYPAGLISRRVKAGGHAFTSAWTRGVTCRQLSSKF